MDGMIGRAVSALAEATGEISAMSEDVSITMEEREFFEEYVPRLQDMLQEQLAFYCGTLEQQTDILKGCGLGFLVDEQRWRNASRMALESEIDGMK